MTIDWLLLLAPLLILPVVLLFRFVGCGELLAGDADIDALPERHPTSYRDYILGQPALPGQVAHDDVPPDGAAVVAYWRLVDGGPLPPSSSAPPAKDEKGFRNGAYAATAGQLPDPAQESEGHAGAITFSSDSLLAPAVSVKDEKCRTYNGGYVLIDFRDGLYPEEFTIEAWVQRHWGPNITGFQHVLFEAGGFYVYPPGTPRERRGFRVWTDRENRWQCHLAPTQGELAFVDTAPEPAGKLPELPHLVKTHVAVTVANEGSGKRVRFYVNGLEKGNALAPGYLPAAGAPLLIAVANSASDPTVPPVTHRPFIGAIQEVVVHRKPLSPQEVENHFAINK